MAVTTDDLVVELFGSKAISRSDRPVLEARLTRLLAVAAAQVDVRIKGCVLPSDDVPDDAPDGAVSPRQALIDELTIRLAAYAYDDPNADGQYRSMGPMWLYSGCAALLAPYRRRRARHAGGSQ